MHFYWIIKIQYFMAENVINNFTQCINLISKLKMLWTNVSYPVHISILIPILYYT